ncbi:ABC transporter substrate-binding protein [Clostridium sp. MSJ-11]|uniref:ABC transporter substrate-binding protein n=1 Tax=Clostridium mobile TaxID=2841512 RepID=A0ABS6EK53_9CLOT|nr:ABC transporter substrate-binding protein [Clostridium mobile]MBU5485428.1 ABC transporter substrate-binding protein [Clostridium mobile]
MKKKFLKNLSLLLTLIILSLSLISCKKVEVQKLEKVRLNEVVRSAFYAPIYVAINKGFFKEQGIEIELTTGQGADKTMQQVLSGSVDIGFAGLEQVIYIYNQKKDDYPVIFGQLTQRDGSFLVGRSQEKDFKWENLKGKTIIGGRPGGVPEMALEYVLKNNGINPNKDVDLITNLAFTATAGAFKSGTGDYVALFEPTATMLEIDNSGFIVASIGESAGVIPYTGFFATQSYIKMNEDTIVNFMKAIYKGQQWVLNNSDEVVAKEIISFFPGTDEKVITNVIQNYKKINAYAENPVLKEENLNRLMDIIQSYNNDLIPERPKFNDIVNNSFSEKALK